MSSESSTNNETRETPYTVFHAVANSNLEGILIEYVKEARNTIVSYLSLRERWSSKSSTELKQGEVLFFGFGMLSTGINGRRPNRDSSKNNVREWKF